MKIRCSFFIGILFISVGLLCGCISKTTVDFADSGDELSTNNENTASISESVLESSDQMLPSRNVSSASSSIRPGSVQDTKLRFVSVTENIEIAVGEQRTISAYIMPPNVRHRTHVKITVDVSGIIEYDSSEYKGAIMEIKGISVGECTVTFKGPREDMIAKSKIIVKNSKNNSSPKISVPQKPSQAK